jgi:ABC-type branched-subunit amino acid transport system ATPase component
MSLLEVRDITMRFGGLTAVDGVTFDLRQGEILAVIGPNGAGKTTLFNAITGVYEPTQGSVKFRGAQVRRNPDLKLFGRAAVVGVLGAISTFVALNAQEIWTAAIDANYLLDKPFPWRKALFDAWNTARAAPLVWGAIPAMVGGILGAAAVLALWQHLRRTPDLIARAGLARTFQNIRLFTDLSLIENVLVGMDSRLQCGYWTNVLRLPAFARERSRSTAEAMELLAFVGLADRAKTAASSLPYGHRRRLEIARALASKPAVLLLDEPAAGMNPSEVTSLMQLIRRVRDRGVTVILIEHHMKLVMGISDRIVVLQYGRKIGEGTPQEIQADRRCIEAYLGAEDEL